uniref:Uncharacterized protein n=1 Tax=Aegilops tauschii TaxID=37682 RepID=M8D2F1_AEGTA
MARHLKICELGYDATASMLNLCGAFMKNYEGDNMSEYNDGPHSSELPVCVDEVNRVSDYCAFALFDMLGVEALIKENDELQKLIDLNMALLSPYRDS